MATIADALWSVDKDRFQNGEITLNYGSKTHSGSQTDVSYQPYVFQYDGRKFFLFNDALNTFFQYDGDI